MNAKTLHRAILTLTAILLTLGMLSFVVAGQQDPLPSWMEGATKQNIIRFVKTVTDKSSSDYVPPGKRIATFDNDGTLWSEKPLYFQLLFAIDRVRQLSPKHPEWKTQQPFRAVLDNDMKALGALGKKGLLELIMATHAGMTTTEFEQIELK